MTAVIFKDRFGKQVKDLMLELKNDWTDEFKDSVILDYLTDEHLILENISARKSNKNYVTATVSQNHCDKCDKPNTTWLDPDGKTWICQDCEQ
jgi:hypothetical protein